MTRLALKQLAVSPIVTYKEGGHALINEAQADPMAFYRVIKMKHDGTAKARNKSTVIYDGYIAMQNILLETYNCVVNGKPALE
ncbi:hypothetical protein [Tropicibacter sp. R16_0]|uniref:hypothetical protein n=1 Tax=Tropicibacter sp. R16_0 TaxID=2821102 RepID=UPI0025711164|nr:hypothetical protein [Tropicibacter sp. R16_0]